MIQVFKNLKVKSVKIVYLQDLQIMTSKYTIPLLLGTVFLILGLVTISDYGLNWDEPFHFLRGQAYAHFFLTGKRTYDQKPRLSPVLIRPGDYISRYDANAWEGTERLVVLPENPRPQAEFKEIIKITGLRTSFYEHQDWNGEYFINNDGPGHPPLIDILSAFSNRFFYQFLGAVGDTTSYKIPFVAVSAFGVYLVALFAYEVTGSRFGALVAGLAMGTYPVFFADSHFSFKDTEQAVFYLGAVWAFWRWLKDEDHWWRWLVIFDIFVALCFGIKWDILFLPFSLIVWLLVIRKTQNFRSWLKFKKLAVAIPLSLVVVFGFVIIIWPYIWADPLPRLFGVFQYYKNIGIGPDLFKPDGFGLPFGIDVYPISLLITQAPIVTLMLALGGILATVLRKRDDKLETGFLAMFWLAVPVVRTMIPGFLIYGGTRQVQEFIPAMAILAALGGVWLIEVLKQRDKLIAKASVLMVYGVFIVIVSRLHPNENVYFNFLVGGIKGAEAKNLIDRSMTYGNVYKQAALWLDQNATQNAKIAFLDGPLFALSPLRLRNDISISPNYFSAYERKGEYIIVLYGAVDIPVFSRRYPFRFLTPVTTIDVDGVPILYIFKNSEQYLKKGFKNEVRTNDFEVMWIADSSSTYLEVNLKKPVRLTRIELKNVSPQCTQPDFHYINELIFFSPTKAVGGVGNNVFSTNERRDLGQSKVEIDLPAEPANRIKIIPQTPLSCFTRGKVTTVSYLKD